MLKAFPEKAIIEKLFEYDDWGVGGYCKIRYACKTLVSIHLFHTNMSDFLARVPTSHNNPAPKEGGWRVMWLL